VAQTPGVAQDRGMAKPPFINVTAPPFNAQGDGKTDDRAAIQAAIHAAANGGGGCVYFPKGVYVIGPEPSGIGGLQLRSHVTLQGEAPRAVILKLAEGANRTLVYGPADVEKLWGSASSDGLENWSLVNLELDGNRANNAAGNGVWTYGFRPTVQNLLIGNVAEHGWRSEWGTGGPRFGMEGLITNLYIENCGKHGFWFAGPHDSVMTNVFVVDASQMEHNRWDSFHIERRATSRFVTCHSWGRAGRPARHRYGLYDASGGNDFVGCIFEGAFSANVYARGQGSTFDNCRLFAAANGVNAVIRTTEIVMKARIGQPLEGGPPSKGVILGEAGDWVAACDIDIYVTGQAAGAVDFTHSSGTNSVRIRGFLASGQAYVGTPTPTDDIDFYCSGRAGAVLRQLPK
jgi:hypothetical protein